MKDSKGTSDMSFSQTCQSAMSINSWLGNIDKWPYEHESLEPCYPSLPLVTP